MIGFSVFNDYGAEVISSSNKTTRVIRTQEITGVRGIGETLYPNPFVPSNSFGTLIYQENPPKPLWIRLKPGYVFFAAGGFMENSGTIAITSRDAAIRSGYLDVFSDSGELIWSAESSRDTPRVHGFVTLDSSTNIDDGAVYSVPMSFTPWLLTSSIPGNVDIDELSVTFGGVMVRFTGSALQFTWVRGGGAPRFNPTLSQNIGVKIPYATIPSLDL